MRLNALALRQDARRAKRIRLGDLVLDTASWSATRAGAPLVLHNASMRILELLMRASPNVVSRRELEYLLWGETPPESNPLRSHLHELRKALDRPFGFSMLRTVHGVGYKLIVEDTGSAD